MTTRHSNGGGKSLSVRRWLMATAVSVAMVATVAGPAGPASAGGASTWTPTGLMTAPRTNGQTATLLNSGGVLVAGGLGDNGTSVSSAELYDPTAGEWSATRGMKGRRTGQGATLLQDGTVLVTGGIDQQNCGSCSTTLKSAELYRPDKGKWKRAKKMSTRRAGHTATLLANGQVLVTGGFSPTSVLGTAELYDPIAGTWTATGSMTTSRYDHTATLLADGKVLVAGGWDNSGASLASAELYDPNSGQWTATASMAKARGAQVAVRLSGTEVLVAGGIGLSQPLPGGFPALAEAEVYNEGTETWVGKGNMTTPRWAHTLTVLTGGSVLAAGGESADVTVLKSSETYDPGSGQWTAGPDMGSLRATHTATLLGNGQVLVEGGFFINNSLSSAELYTP